MGLDVAIDLLKAAGYISKTIPVVGSQLEGVFGLATHICEMAEGAESNREALQQLGVEITGYTTAVGSAIQKRNMSPGANPNIGPEGADSMTHATRSNAQLEETEAHVAELASTLKEVEAFLSQKIKSEEKRLARTFGPLLQLFYDILYKKKNEEKLKMLRENIKISVNKFHIASDILSLDAIKGLVADMKKIQTLQEKIQQDQMQIREGQIHIRKDQTHIREDQTHIREDQKHIRKDQSYLLQQQEENLLEIRWNRLEVTLGPTHTARFDGNGAPSGCLEGTRVDLLSKLVEWAQDPTSSPILWLSGLAGTGKSTVARSFCDILSQTTMVASFFISRHFDDRKTSQKILHSIVYQIGCVSRRAKAALAAAYVNDPVITTRPLSQQITHLLENPLRGLGDLLSPLILVIDALDECNMEAGREGGDLLPLLAAVARRLPKTVKLLITSREETTITRMFTNISSAPGGYGVVRLHLIDDFIVNSDIRHFFIFRFQQIAQNFLHLKNVTWPSEDELRELLIRAGVLFIYAATVIRFLDNSKYNPQDRLRRIIDQSAGSSSTNSPYAALDTVYHEILRKAVDDAVDIQDELCIRIRMLANTLVLLRHPLDSLALSQLLDVDRSLIDIDVGGLSAVLIVPEEPKDPIKIFHLSFPDYLLTRCGDERFTINAASHHTYLFQRCLAIMKRMLKEDICNIENPWLLNTEIEDLQTRVDLHIPPALQYACQHWLTHLSRSSSQGDDQVAELREFCSHHLLHWMETLSLLGILPEALVSLPFAVKWCKDHLGPQDLIASLLNDAEQMIRRFFDPISAAALQVYCTGLTFMPTCSLYIHETAARKNHRPLVQLDSERSTSWGPFLRMIRGHATLVTSVSFSPDGKHVVSGSNDRTVRIWDTATGEAVAKLEGHTKLVTSVAFLPDNRHIISGSWDKTVRVWDAATGETVATLAGHTDSVYSVTFSPGGNYIASSALDSTVRIWDVATGETATVLGGHTNPVFSVAFSPDGKRVVLGLWNHTVQIRDLTTGKPIMTLTGHINSVASVAFSSDGKHVASGSWDRTVRLWDVTTGEAVAVLEGHSESVISVVFSPDGQHVVSGSEDNRVRMWDVATGKTVGTLEGHTDSVSSVAFSRDGKYIVSGSHDETLRIWDAAASEMAVTLQNTKSPLASVTFSRNGKHVISRYLDDTEHISTIKGRDSLTRNFDQSAPPTAIKEASIRFSLDHLLGWLTVAGTSTPDVLRRLCWIPIDRRPDGRVDLLDSFDRKVAFGSANGTVTLLSCANF